MKNLYDSGGRPIAATNQDVKKAVEKAALHAYGEGLDSACDCFKQAFQQAIDKGHTEMPLTDLLVLVEELRTIAKKSIP